MGVGRGSQTVVSGASATLPLTRSGDGALPRRGQLVGRYIVLGEIGAGAMGVVLRAYDPELDRSIALKVVRARGRDASEREYSSARLLREAQTLARLSHPNIVGVYDVGSHTTGAASETADEAPSSIWIAMELVDGEDLQAWLARPHPWAEVLDVLLRAAEGLHAAHLAGVVHRDFKPANVLIASSGRVVVTDFGLAREGGDSGPQGRGDDSGPQGRVYNSAVQRDAADAARHEPDPGLTEAGVTVGTPPYMAPEQHLGAATDARADQYSFCVALYEGLFGARPFTGTDPLVLLDEKRKGLVGPPRSDRKVPRRLWPAIARGLSLHARDRFPSMAELAGELSRVAGAPRRRATAVAAVVAIGLAAILVPRMRGRADALCRGGEDRLAPVWNDGRRAAIDEAFAATAMPFARESSGRVVEAIDERAAAWVEARQEACAATWMRGEQSPARLDRRMACLDRRLAELDAVLGVLVVADAATVERANEIEADLPGIARCADVDAIAIAIAIDPEGPSDAATAGQVIAARADLDRVRALVAAGRVREAEDALERVSAAAIEHPPLAAEIALEHGRLQEAAGRPARASLQDAARLARAAKHRRVEAQAWIALVRVARRELDVDRGRFAGALASATLEPLGERELSAELALELGGLAFAAGDDATAERELQRALALREALYGEDHVAVAEVLGRMAGVVSRRGDASAAIAMLERVLAIQRATLGDGHPRIGATLGNLGLVHASVGHFDEGLAALRECEAIVIAAWGEDHPSVAMAADSLGDVLRRAGRPDEALASFQRALAGYDRAFGPDDVALAAPLLGLGEALLALQRPAEARVHLERALSLLGDDAPPIQLADTRFALARALAEVHEPQRAATLARAAEKTYRAQLHPLDDRMPALESWLAAHAGR